MPVAYQYGKGIAGAFGSPTLGNAPNTDFLSDDIRAALLTSAHSFNPAHEFWSEALVNEIAGAGYTANGQALAAKTLTVTAANLWATAWAVATAYTVGQIVRPTVGNGFVYRCVVAGTSHATIEPTWSTTPFQTIADNTVTWACVGRAVIQFDAADPSWPNSTFTTRWAVIYNRTPATDATRPLLWAIDFDSDKSPSAGTFTLQLHALGLGVVTTF